MVACDLTAFSRWEPMMESIPLLRCAFTYWTLMSEQNLGLLLHIDTKYNKRKRLHRESEPGNLLYIEDDSAAQQEDT
jgi:hypothetical protein